MGGGPGAGGRALLASYSRREAEGEARLHHLQTHGKAVGESYRYHAPVFDLTLFDEAVPGEHESAYSRLNSKWETQEAGAMDAKKLKNADTKTTQAEGGTLRSGGDGDEDGNAADAEAAGLDTAAGRDISSEDFDDSASQAEDTAADASSLQSTLRRGFVVSPAFGGLRFPVRQQGGGDGDSGGAAAGAGSGTLDILVGPASPSVADGGTERLLKQGGELLLCSDHLTSVDELLEAEHAHTQAEQGRTAQASKTGDALHANMHAATAPYVLLVTDKRIRVLHTASNKVHWGCPLFGETGRKAARLQDMNVIHASPQMAGQAAMEPSSGEEGGDRDARPAQVTGQLDKHVLSISVDQSRRGWALLMGNVQRAAIAYKALSDALSNTPDRMSLRKLESVAYRMNKKKGGVHEALPSLMSRSRLLLQRRLLTFRRRSLLLHVDTVLVHSWAPAVAEVHTHYTNLSHLRDVLLVRGAPLSGMVRSGSARGDPQQRNLASVYASGGRIQGGVGAYRIRVRHVPIPVQGGIEPEDEAGMSSRLGARPPQSPVNPDIASAEPQAVAPSYTVHRTYRQWARLFAFVPRSWHLPPPAGTARGAGRAAGFVLPYLPLPQPAFGRNDVQDGDYGTDGMLNTLQRALSQLVFATQREAILQAHQHPSALPRPDWLLLRKELERFLGVV